MRLPYLESTIVAVAGAIVQVYDEALLTDCSRGPKRRAQKQTTDGYQSFGRFESCPTADSS